MNYSVFLFGALFINIVGARIEIDLFKSERRMKKEERESKNTPRNDSVDLYKFMDNEYYGMVGVGSPSKAFKFLFDTTWADIWLPSAHCSWTEIVCHMHNRYDSSASSSYIWNGTSIPVNLTTKDYSLRGILAVDTFHLPHLKVENQTFMEATHISWNPFWQYIADGIIGLAFREASHWKTSAPFFYSLVQQNLIDENIFTFYLNRDETTERAGKIILGGKQRKHVKEDTLTKLEVTYRRMWEIRIDSIFVEINKTEYPICEKCPAIFDSSSHGIEGPAASIENINYKLNGKYIPGLNKYSVNCRMYAKLPKIHFMLNGYDYIIQSKYYVQRFSVHNVEACFSPFIPSPVADSQIWQLGGAFMMEFYTEFDVDNAEIWIGETVF